MNVTHSKTGQPDSVPPPAVAPVPPVEPPADTPAAPWPSPSEGFEEPRALGSVLDDALERMERRARGDERPVPLPWSSPPPSGAVCGAAP